MKIKVVSKESTIGIIIIQLITVLALIKIKTFIWIIVEPPILYLFLFIVINTCSYKTDGLWWFRIFGYGIAWKDKRLHPPLFSERYDYTFKLRIGNWRFYFLKP